VPLPTGSAGVVTGCQWSTPAVWRVQVWAAVVRVAAPYRVIAEPAIAPGTGQRCTAVRNLCDNMPVVIDA